MLSFKKFHGEDLLQLALLLSLLRVDVDLYLGISNRNFGLEYREIGIGSTSAYIQSYIHNLHNRLSGGHQVHPKSVESIFLNQQSLFYELNLLGRYQNAYQIERPSEITTYLLSEEQGGNDNSSEDGNSVQPITDNNPNRNVSSQAVTTRITTQPQSSSQPNTSTNTRTTATTIIDIPVGANLSKEDMDLIEVLLRQDVDLGVKREQFDAQLRKVEKNSDQKEEEQPEASTNIEDLLISNPWAGLNYTIDSETGEHEIQDDEIGLAETYTSLSLTNDDILSLTNDFQHIPLNETLQFSTFDNQNSPQEDFKNKSSDYGLIVDKDDLFGPDLSTISPLIDADDNFTDQIEQFEDMIQSTNRLQIHSLNQSQGVQYLRTNSLEQRWQDLANILSLPLNSETENQNPLAMISSSNQQAYVPNNSNSGDGLELHNGSLVSLATSPMDVNSNVNTFPSEMAAVATSSNRYTNASEPMRDVFRSALVDQGSLMYPRNQSLLNQTTDGFLSSLLNDDDLELMDLTLADSSLNGTERFVQQNNETITDLFRSFYQNDDVDSSSDSAVSSLCSAEQMDSTSDDINNRCRSITECSEACTNSSNNTEEQNFYYNAVNNSFGSNKPVSYDSNYSSEHHATSPLSPSVAQKKIHLYGKKITNGNDIYNSNGNMNGEWEPKYSDCLNNGQEYSGERGFEIVEGATAIELPEPKYSCIMEFTQQQVPCLGQMGQVRHNHTYQLSPDAQNVPQRPVLRDKLRKREEDHLSRDERRAKALKVPLTSSEIINLPMDEFNERLSKYDLTEVQLALIRDIRRRGKNKVAAQNCRKRKLDQILTLAEVVQDLQQSKDSVIIEHDWLLMRKQRLQEKYNQLYTHVFQSMRDSHGNVLPSDQYSLQQAANGSMILVPRNNRQRNNLELDPMSGARAKKKDDKK